MEKSQQEITDALMAGIQVVERRAYVGAKRTERAKALLKKDLKASVARAATDMVRITETEDKDGNVTYTVQLYVVAPAAMDIINGKGGAQ